jgi:hypothetical protein
MISDPVYLQTYHNERRGEVKNTEGLSLYEFESGKYYGSEENVPVHGPYRDLNDPQRERIAQWSLELILRFEFEAWKDWFKCPYLKLDEILDEECPKWISAMGLIDLPPRSEVSINLLNTVLTAFRPLEGRNGIKLSTGALDRLLDKLTSCHGRGRHFHEEIQYYTRSTVLYCGYCAPNVVLAKCPMSLGEVCKHIQHRHRDTGWNLNMVRQSLAGQRVYDGRCANDLCKAPLLIEAFPGEQKTGFKCKNCRRDWCPSCTVAADYIPWTTWDRTGNSKTNHRLIVQRWERYMGVKYVDGMRVVLVSGLLFLLERLFYCCFWMGTWFCIVPKIRHTLLNKPFF